METGGGTAKKFRTSVRKMQEFLVVSSGSFLLEDALKIGRFRSGTPEGRLDPVAGPKKALRYVVRGICKGAGIGARWKKCVGTSPAVRPRATR